jgi:DNA-binding transcriptional LysR family regulator
MNARDFLDVKAICDTGSLRKAAMLLGISQPTLSNRVAHLESQVGAVLFKRRRGQSQPTDLALFIAGRASTMAEEASRLTREVKRLATGKTGVVRVGLVAAPARVFFPDVVMHLAGRYPAIGLDIFAAPTPQLTARLLQRDLDLLVCPALEPPADSVVSELQLETDIIVLARPDHPLCTRPVVTLAELRQHPMALPSVEPRYVQILKRDHGIDIETQPGRILCSDPGTLVRLMLRSPRFFTAAPRPYFAPEIESGSLAIVNVTIAIPHMLYLHYNRDVLPLPAVETVKDVIRETFIGIRAAQPQNATTRSTIQNAAAVPIA